MFPLHVWMTGSGTQFNMNVNEVISNRGCQEEYMDRSLMLFEALTNERFVSLAISAAAASPKTWSCIDPSPHGSTTEFK